MRLEDNDASLIALDKVVAVTPSEDGDDFSLLVYFVGQVVIRYGYGNNEIAFVDDFEAIEKWLNERE